MYKILRISLKAIFFPLMLLFWIFFTPIIVLVCFFENKNFNGFYIDFMSWIETIKDFLPIDN